MPEDVHDHAAPSLPEAGPAEEHPVTPDAEARPAPAAQPDEPGLQRLR
jgi:hypothetical protein